MLTLRWAAPGLLIAVALPAGPARAQLDAGAEKPYRLEVVLHFAQHRFLTSAFRDEVSRQVGDLLGLNFGALVRVAVRHEHPLLKDILARGLEPVLDGWDALEEVQTHFVLIDYTGGRYRLRSRQHDGLTGLTGPPVQQEEVGDRRLVARTIARLIDRGFAPVGTVTASDASAVTMTLWGAGLDVPLGRWVKPGQAFAVSRILDDGGKQRARRVDWALLTVTEAPTGRSCNCRYYHRYTGDLLDDRPGVAGYRCLRLPMVSTRLRLRFVADDGKPQGALAVHISHTGFGERPTQLTTNAEGVVITPDAYDGVAFVEVLAGGKVRVRFPLAIVDSRPVVCPVPIKEGDLAKDAVWLRQEHWQQRLLEGLALTNQRVGELNELLKGKAPEKALAKAQEGLKFLDNELDAVRREYEELRRVAGLDLASGRQHLHTLREQRDELQKFVGTLQNLLRQEAADRALQTLLTNARLLEQKADFEGAIGLYRQALKDRPDQPKIKAHLEQLQSGWQLKGPAHQQARTFIYQTWPREMATAKLKALLPRAREAFEECKRVGDRLSPRKMLAADVTHGLSLQKRVQVLRRAPNPEELKQIQELVRDLRQLRADVTAFIQPTKARGS